MIEPKNDTTDITANSVTENQMNLSGQEFRKGSNFQNLVSNESIESINHEKRKRKTQDSSEDEAEKPRFNNLIKKNKFYEKQKVIIKMQVLN